MRRISNRSVTLDIGVTLLVNCQALLGKSLCTPQLIPHKCVDSVCMILVNESAEIRPTIRCGISSTVLVLPLIVNDKYLGMEITLLQLLKHLVVNDLLAGVLNGSVTLGAFSEGILLDPAACNRTVPETRLGTVVTALTDSSVKVEVTVSLTCMVVILCGVNYHLGSSPASVNNLVTILIGGHAEVTVMCVVSNSAEVVLTHFRNYAECKICGKSRNLEGVVEHGGDGQAGVDVDLAVGKECAILCTECDVGIESLAELVRAAYLPVLTSVRAEVINCINTALAVYSDIILKVSLIAGEGVNLLLPESRSGGPLVYIVGNLCKSSSGIVLNVESEGFVVVVCGVQCGQRIQYRDLFTVQTDCNAVLTQLK